MATIGTIEKKIFRVEGFDVVILRPNGQDVRSDLKKLPPYPFEVAMKNRSNVSNWKKRRFRRKYPGFDVDVLDASGERVNGRMLLGTVRDTYLES